MFAICPGVNACNVPDVLVMLLGKLVIALGMLMIFKEICRECIVARECW